MLEEKHALPFFNSGNNSVWQVASGRLASRGRAIVSQVLLWCWKMNATYLPLALDTLKNKKLIDQCA